MRYLSFLLVCATFCWGSQAAAQRTDDNAVTEAEDAFGVSVGSERIGIYSDREVRGFSPVTAGNVRVEGVYIDLKGQLNNRLTQGNTVRVGLSALNYPFPAPTGIVDFSLRSGSGPASISPAITLGTEGHRIIELEGFVPLAGDQLSISGAISARRNSEGPGQVNRIFNFGVVPRWQPSESVRLTPFYGYSYNREDVRPTVFVAGSFLPPDLQDENYGQDWADQVRIQQNVGLLSTIRLGPEFAISAGVFNSRVVQRENYSDTYRNAARDGLADHSISYSPRQVRASTSGEARLTWRQSSAKSGHAVHLMARGRQADSLFGGSTSSALGRDFVGVARPVARPGFVAGPQSRDDVRQITFGIGYDGVVPRRGQISLGLQKSHYEKAVTDPAGGLSSLTDRPWLFNVGGAIFVTERLAVYSTYTRGLEENGTAPDSAVNRGDPLPAALTTQRDFGLRYRLGPEIQLVAGAFDLRKPYFSSDISNVFSELGLLRTRGIEFSLAGPVLAGLNVVAGGVFMDPGVSGEAVALGRVGPQAVGQTRRLLRLDFDYRFPSAPDFSIEGGVINTGPVIAAVRPDPLTGVQFAVPSRTVLDIGGRYRFNIAQARAVLRLQVMNVTNVGGWEPNSSGGLQSENRRRVQAELSADF